MRPGSAAFTYDVLANILSVTRLPGTSNAATTSYTYEPTYSQVTSITDPLNHVWTLGHDGLGNLTSVDPLAHQTSATYNGAGQIKTLTDPLSHTTSFSYAAGCCRRSSMRSARRVTSRVIAPGARWRPSMR